jgi:hypothetical protein
VKYDGSNKNKNEEGIRMGNGESRYCLQGNSGLFLTCPEHTHGVEIELRGRNFSDNLQKFRIQPHGGGCYIRFDKHPQPAIRVRHNTNQDGTQSVVELYNASTDDHGEWVLALASGNGLPDREGAWSEVVICNARTNTTLVDMGNGRLVARNIQNATNNNIEAAARWKLHYAGSAWSASEVTMAVLIPIGVAGAVVGAVAAIPEVAGAAGVAVVNGGARAIAGISMDVFTKIFAFIVRMLAPIHRLVAQHLRLLPMIGL